jgi:hypothetical protein
MNGRNRNFRKEFKLFISVSLAQSGCRQPVVLVDICATSTAKIPIIRRAANRRFDEVCRVKDRLIGDFLGFYTQSAINS